MRAPVAVIARDTPIMQKERKNRLILVFKNLAPSFEEMKDSFVNCILRFLMNLIRIRIANISVIQFATSVPVATPLKPMSTKKTQKKLAAMFMIFMEMDITMGCTVFCMPINHPLIDSTHSSGGIPIAQIWKYSVLSALVSSEGEITVTRISEIGFLNIRINSPMSKAVPMDLANIEVWRTISFAPYASAVSPEVPIRKNEHSHKMTFSIVLPAAIAAINTALPRCPEMAVSHNPSNGTVMFVAIAGRDSDIMLWFIPFASGFIVQ